MPEQQLQPEELDLRAYFRPLWRRKWIVLAIVLVATAGTYFLSSRQMKTYVASGTVYIQVADPGVSVTNPVGAGPPTSNDLQNAAQLLTSPAVTAAASKILGEPLAAAGSVSASATSTDSFVKVTATSHQPALASRLVNASIRAYLASRTHALVTNAREAARGVQIQLNSIPKHLAAASPEAISRQTLLQQLASDNAIAASPNPGAQQVQVASEPGTPASPKPKRDAIFGGVVGLVLAIIVAYVLDLLDRRLLGVRALEALFGRPVLAALPHVGNPTPLVAGEAPVVPSPFLEPLRTLAVFLRLTNRSTQSRTMVVTSTLPQEGKSTVTRDLAIIYAESGSRVLVIDCDLRRPSMARLFGIEADRGLVHILRDGAPLSEVAVRGAPTAVSAEAEQSDPVARSGIGLHLEGFVDVVTHGETVDSPLGLISSEMMSRLVREAAEEYDIVLIDTAPLLIVADTLPLLEDVDGVLLVARLGRTTRGAANRFEQLVDRLSNVNLYGIVANDLRAENEDGYGSYGYYDGYRTRIGKNGEPDGTRRGAASGKPAGSATATARTNDSAAPTVLKASTLETEEPRAKVGVASGEVLPSAPDGQTSQHDTQPVVVTSPVEAENAIDELATPVGDPPRVEKDAKPVGAATARSPSSGRRKGARRQTAQRINAAYSLGGAKLAFETVKEVLGVQGRANGPDRNGSGPANKADPDETEQFRPKPGNGKS